MKYSLVVAASLFMLAANAQNAHATPYPKGSIGVFNAGTWWLDTDRSLGWSGEGPGQDEVHHFGTAGDQPVVYYGVPCFTQGTAGIGVVRGNTWKATYNDLDYQFSADSGNTFTFGQNPQSPTIWNVAVSYVGGTFLIDNNGNHQQDSGDVSLHWGGAGQLPVIGTWGGPSGVPHIGTFVPSSSTWFVDYDGSNTWTNAGDKTWTFGLTPSDLPFVMPFSDGIDRIGVFNGGNWYVDLNNNHRYDGATGGDVIWQFGNIGDTPVISREGSWTGQCPIDGGTGLHPV